MAPALLVQRNVRPQRAQQEFDDESDQDLESGADIEEADSDAQSMEDEDVSESESGSEDSDEQERRDNDEGEADDDSAEDVEDDHPEERISSVSFGALKQAQDVLARKRKREPETAVDQEQKLQALRDRLQQIKKSKITDEGDSSKTISSRVKSTQNKDRLQSDAGVAEDSLSDSDSAPSEQGAGGHSRSSKHAPASQSTRYQVSRKRVVIDVPKRQFRDPRFDAIQQRHSGHNGDSEKAYGFLREYEKDEIAELRSAVKKTRNEDEKEILRRTAGSMENRIKSKEAKERNQEVIRQHRREERAKVEQGKTPYYLKDKDVRERALVERFKGMKSKEREKVIEKRQLRESQKEKKRMPRARRMVG